MHHFAHARAETVEAHVCALALHRIRDTGLAGMPKHDRGGAAPPPLLHRGAGLPEEAALAAALENVDHPGKMSGLERRAGPVRRPVTHDPIVRRHQLRLGDPGRDDLGDNHVADRADDLDHLVARQLGHARFS